MKKSHKSIFIILLCLIICLMAVAYMTFYTTLSINAKGVYKGRLSVKIESIKTNSIVGKASNKFDPTHTDDSATFYCFFNQPSDSIEYAIKVTNSGNINASLKKINLNYEHSNDIEFSSYGINAGDILKPGESKILYVKVVFKETGNGEQKLASATVNLEYVQADTTESSLFDISGVVDYNGEACVNCSVVLYKDCDIVYETTTNNQGQYFVTNVFKGSYDLYAKNDYYSTRKLVTVNSSSYNFSLSIKKGINMPICSY